MIQFKTFLPGGWLNREKVEDMTMTEKKVQSIKKEIEKLTKSLERYNGICEKKIDKCEKLECKWTDEEMRIHRDDNTMSDKQWSAWFEMRVANGNIKDTESRLENAFARLERAEEEFKKVEEKTKIDEEIENKELSWLEAREKKEDEFYKWLSQFKAECLLDGIIINEAEYSFISGNTKSGKRFAMYINSGYSTRSRHCYTLRIEGNTYFTSGEFSTGYKYLMNN